MTIEAPHFADMSEAGPGPVPEPDPTKPFFTGGLKAELYDQRTGEWRPATLWPEPSKEPGLAMVAGQVKKEDHAVPLMPKHAISDGLRVAHNGDYVNVWVTASPLSSGDGLVVRPLRSAE